MTSEEYEQAEIADVYMGACRAIRDTIQAAHASGKHAPDAPGKPAEWRGQTEAVHVMRAAAHLLEWIADNCLKAHGPLVAKSLSMSLADAVGSLVYMITDNGIIEGIQPTLEGFESDDIAGLSLPHAVTRLAMAAAVKGKDATPRVLPSPGDARSGTALSANSMEELSLYDIPERVERDPEERRGGRE